MNNRILYIVSIVLCCLGLVPVQAQDDATKYERSSLYMVMIKHPKYAYNNEIEYVFKSTELPDRFNDHSLKVKSIVFSNDDNDETENITRFINKEKIGQRMVSKWFGYTKQKGAFNVELLKERGLYNASALDIAIADRSTRGIALLEDAGENLINDTYVVFHDIRYVDKSTRWNTAMEILKWATTIASAVGSGVIAAKGGGSASSLRAGNSVSQLGESMNWLYSSIQDDIKGFRVDVTSYLYRLKWTPDISGQFFSSYYTDSIEANADKVAAYLSNDQLYKMEYVGKIHNKSSKTTLNGVQTNEDLIRKVCTRAIDKNLADLQHEFEEFRIKSVLISTSPIAAYIGKKEGITTDSKFEVLERIEDESGRYKYERVGIIKPEQIWDNRFMADAEKEDGYNLEYTTFKKVSGRNFSNGMMIREIK